MRYFSDFLRYQARQSWLGLNRTVFAVSTIPIAFSICVALALAFVPQILELYLSTAEEVLSAPGGGADRLHALFALAAMGLLSSAIYWANASLSRTSADQIFSEHHSAVVDRQLAARVAAIGVLAAGLPWIGLAYGVDVAVENAITYIERIGYHANAKSGAAHHFKEGLDIGVVNKIAMQDLHRKLASLKGNLHFIRQLGWWLLLCLAVALGLRQWLRFAGGRLHRSRKVAPHPSVSAGNSLGSLSDAVRQRMSALAVGLRGLSTSVTTALVLGSLMVPLVIETFDPLLQARSIAPGTIDIVVGWLRTWSPDWSTWQKQMSGSPIQAWVPGPIGFWAMSTVVLALLTNEVWRRTRASRRNPDRNIGVRRLTDAVRWVLVLMLLACIFSGFFEFSWVDIARAFGPLAMTVALCVVILRLIEILGLVSRQTGFPVIAVCVAVGFVVVVNKLESGNSILAAAVIFAALSVFFALAQANITGWVAAFLVVMSAVGAVKYRRSVDILGWKPSVPAEPASQPASLPPAIFDQFNAWYEARADARRIYGEKNNSAPYPVFVIAAEGGGIYAAAASSAFLARLQERCPSFAQHVFAISGVSGGAVGASIFHGAVDADRPKVEQPQFADEGCGELTPGGLQAKVASVVREDHLSALAGRFVPDVLGTYSDRAKGLQKSLEASMSQHFASAAVGLAKPPWSEPFKDHWNVRRPAPALVLNATWASVGNRVVFAPFNVESSNVVTLNDFTALGVRSGWEKDPNLVGLTEAAVVSARFPGVVAAYEMKNKANRRWYFVDGGYVDASGALTAQEIYRSLVEKQSPPRPNRDDGGFGRVPSAAGQWAPWHVDFRLVLLTSTQSNSKEKGTEGAQLRDLAAPVEALFNVRSLLSRNAVRETISKTDPDTTEATTNLGDNAQLGKPKGWKVTIVEINLDNFELALGWKISGLTHDIVSLQLGQANLCEGASDAAKDRRQAASGLLGHAASKYHHAIRVSRASRQPASELLRRDRAPKAEKARRALEVAKTIRSNSCVMAAIEKLLNGGKIALRQ